MKKINLGHVELISDPSLRPRVTPSQSNAKSRIIVEPVQQVQKLTGDKILTPGWLPSSEWKLARAYQKLLVSSSSQRFLGSILKYREGEARWLTIEQVRFAEFPVIKIPFDAWEGNIGANWF